MWDFHTIMEGPVFRQLSQTDMVEIVPRLQVPARSSPGSRQQPPAPTNSHSLRIPPQLALRVYNMRLNIVFHAKSTARIPALQFLVCLRRSPCRCGWTTKYLNPSLMIFKPRKNRPRVPQEALRERAGGLAGADRALCTIAPPILSKPRDSLRQIYHSLWPVPIPPARFSFV
jgi:hypothetical protein